MGEDVSDREGAATSALMPCPAPVGEELLCCLWAPWAARRHRPLIRVSTLNKAVTQLGRLPAPLNPATDNPGHGELSVIRVLNTSQSPLGAGELGHKAPS